ncbi:glycosyl transferase family protein (plasmid) [Sulfitobacter sp. LCG007]
MTRRDAIPRGDGKADPNALSRYVAAIGRGASKGRSLSVEEAREAMRLILDDAAAPEAVGAFLMVLRFRGETPEELAGFAMALRDSLPPWEGPSPAIDWPSYAAGRTRGLPWFLLSARLVARAGLPVLLHGWNAWQSPVASVRDALGGLDIPAAGSLGEAQRLLEKRGIAYLPLETFSPRALDLLKLRSVFGLRSILNTVVRMVNPGGAGCIVQGVFHPGYRPLQQEAAVHLGLENLAIIKGGGGEFERHPGKDVTVYGLRAGEAFTRSFAALASGHRRLADAPADPAELGRLWRGESTDRFAHDIVLGTAALALEAHGSAAPDQGLPMAEALWETRLKRDG